MIRLTVIFGKIWRYSAYADSHLLFGFSSPSGLSAGLIRLLSKRSSPCREVVPHVGTAVHGSPPSTLEFNIWR